MARRGHFIGRAHRWYSLNVALRIPDPPTIVAGRFENTQGRRKQCRVWGQGVWSSRAALCCFVLVGSLEFGI